VCLEIPHHWFSCCDPFGKLALKNHRVRFPNNEYRYFKHWPNLTDPEEPSEIDVLDFSKKNILMELSLFYNT
jgi:hypothetical protein